MAQVTRTDCLGFCHTVNGVHWFRAVFYSPHAHHWVQEFVQSCEVGQRNKTEHLHLAGLLQPLPIPHQVWSDIVMDFIETLSRVRGKSILLIVVDRFSKMAHFIPLSHPYSASLVAKSFDNVVRLHSLPCSIITDRDPMTLFSLVNLGKNCFSWPVSSCC
jgi:hypothetical protein